MPSPLIDSLRQSRKSPGVLKARVISIRSRDKIKPIFIFEGDEDVGPYSVWIARCDNSIDYEPLPANGKDQVLLFRDHAQAEEIYLREGVYFFIDRDFDDLKGFTEGPDIFMTDMYSTENYLVSECVFESLLKDEFKCAGEKIDRALALFRSTMEGFFQAMLPVNRRIYCARRLSIRISGGGIDNKINKYVTIELEGANAIADMDRLKLLIPLEREPSSEEEQKILAEFEGLCPSSRHRGKFIQAFFLRWLELLAEERSSGKKSIFDSLKKTHFSPQQISLRSLATRSIIPADLCDFLEKVNCANATSPA